MKVSISGSEMSMKSAQSPLDGHPKEAVDSLPAAEAKPPRVLLGAVIAMGVAMLAGFIVVIATIMYRASHPPASPASAVKSADIIVPAGAKVTAMTFNEGKLAVHLSAPGGTGEIVVIDIRKGREVGRYPLKPQ